MGEIDQTIYLLLFVSGFAAIGWSFGYRVWLDLALEDTARRLGLSLTEGPRERRFAGRWQGIEIVLAETAIGEGKGPYVFQVVSRARIPRLAPATLPDAGPVLEPVAVIDGWIEHERGERLHHRKLEPLLERLVRTARRHAAQLAP